ncbi:MAG: DUF1538 domain-containing protein [Treponema sp.]|nr:DUF1538 domain-containing protein [Treponema sp.]
MIFFLIKLKDSVLAIAPIIALVLILGFTVASIDTMLIIKFLFGAVLIIFGLSIFLAGVELAIMPLGSHTGEIIFKSKKLWILVVAGIILGFFISLAEPGMIVLSNQVDLVTMGQLSGIRLLVFVSVGFAVVLTIGLLRIFSKIPLHMVLIAFYLLIGAATMFTSAEFLALAFDSSGATTGILAVPFILALGVGVASGKKDSLKSEEDSFGLVAMASAGAVIGVLVLYMVSRGAYYDTSLPITINVTDSVLHSFTGIIPSTLYEGFITLLPLLVIFIILQLTVLKLSEKRFRKMIMGFIYSYTGLILFFLGVDGGFMDAGTALGYNLASLGNNALTISVGFLIGLVTIAAEPAVYVQTHQIENVTSGHVKRKAVLAPLCLGVGLAVMLSVVRILYPAIQLWHFLLPGFAAALGLTFFVPKLFVGIAFDAGGVATGPMTATFILAFIQGVAASRGDANLLRDGFGMISLVCMIPIVTMQILGLVYKVKTKKQ